MDLTQRGIFLFSEGMSASALATAAQRFERLGYGAVWFPEAVGREPVLAASWVLANTSKLIAATGIVNIYSRDPMACAMMQRIREIFDTQIGVEGRKVMFGDYAK